MLKTFSTTLISFSKDLSTSLFLVLLFFLFGVIKFIPFFCRDPLTLLETYPLSPIILLPTIFIFIFFICSSNTLINLDNIDGVMARDGLYFEYESYLYYIVKKLGTSELELLDFHRKHPLGKKILSHFISSNCYNILSSVQYIVSLSKSETEKLIEMENKILYDFAKTQSPERLYQLATTILNKEYSITELKPIPKKESTHN